MAKLLVGGGQIKMARINYRRAASSPARVRRQDGQALAEGAAALVVITSVVVLLIMFMVNLYNVISCRTMLEVVASEAAKVYEGNEYFLGMQRQDFSTTSASTSASNVATALATELGLPTLSSVTFSEQSTSDGSGYITCEITTSLPLPFVGAVFPNLVSMDVKGVSAAGGMAVHPPAVVNFSARDSSNVLVGCQLPAYGLYTDHGQLSQDGDPSKLNAQLGNCPAPGPIKMPYGYTGFSMGKDTTPMLNGTKSGDAEMWTAVPNSDPSKPAVPTPTPQR